ncbi:MULTISPECIES: hypothetical protein [unclassified Lentimonas]|uniref:hypothetical protein n=1 Tax=unclassified Lentimonas TaxID=2630993 RepID=UPI00132588B0|nr:MULTISPECIES: hypothetical protein [unclassified Lentimonas]CAA6677581.1 Unannotated [Lentimonas sp. CC4]CAA6684321.1 Unannotated [Lentimonas sp. CC6]CAA6692127.1 Unannotated [Lentimonas sp. CC19]CAA6694491.1 Unannotated [Lentimonas sp. CC10]CAA7070620.1 Unannotated [Lentimonas sp. CC11]
MIKQYITCTLTALFSLFILPAKAHSQGSSTESAVTGANQLRAISVGLENDLKEMVILDASLQSVGKLSLRSFGFSQPFSCPIVDGNLVFGVPNGMDEDGKPLFKPVASVKWKSSYKQACLLFIPKSLVGKSESTKEYAIQVLDMSPRGFEFGHTKLMNLTPFDTMVRIGEHQSKLKPWSNSDVSKIKELTGVKMAQIGVYYLYDDTIHNAKQTRFRYMEDTRYITVIYPDIQNKRIEVRTIKDFGRLY